MNYILVIHPRVFIDIFINIRFYTIYIKQHMVETLGIVLVAVITSIVGPIIVEKVKSRLRNSKLKDPVIEELEHSTVIANEIEEVREHLKADRSWIIMYHNGGHFLANNKSMKKFSMMFEKCKDEKDRVAHTFSNLPVSLYTQSTHELLTNKHIYITDFEDPNISTYGLKGSAKGSGSRSSYCVALFDIKTENCIGSFGVDYKRKKTLTDKQKTELNDRSQRIAGYLSVYLNN